MPIPFPGMDPYLESPAHWQGLHNTLIAELQLALGPLLRPRYYVRVEIRTYLAEPTESLLVGIPDVTVHARGAEAPEAREAIAREPSTTAIAVQVPVPDGVREAYLEIRAADSGDVVTSVEVLSPWNKRAGEGRRVYEEKRRTVLGTLTSLVEIDLLRAGEPLPVLGARRDADYRILVSRGDRRPRAELYLFSVRDPIPRFHLPLRRGDVEPEVDLRERLDDIYDRAAYDLSIDYRAEPAHPFAEPARAWADALLRSAGRR